MNIELNFPPNFEGLVLGCIDADFMQVNTRWKTGTLTLSENGLREEKNNNYFNGVSKK